MKPIVNARPWPVELAHPSAIVEPGESIEVDDEVAEQLLAQPANWREPARSKKKATARRAASGSTTDTTRST